VTSLDTLTIKLLEIRSVAERLEGRTSNAIIIQADAVTDVGMIRRAMTAAASAGYSHVQLAVERTRTP
jgi:biopolymer transport protein ExbD